MPELNAQQENALRGVIRDIAALREKLQTLHAETRYEDLEHADLGLQIVNHAVEEVLEHTGLGGEIKHQSDASAHDRASGWLNDAQRIQSEARALLASQPNEDLETAIKALTIATGSLEEVVERYE